jgi:ABC-type uncharacterized transport system auxiliary subunit
VIRTVESYAPDYSLTCDVQAIEEYDSQESWYAHLAVEYQLVEERTGQVAWKKLFDLRKTVQNQEPVYVVREISSLLETMHERLVQELEVALDEARVRTVSDSGSPAKK